MCNVQAPYQKGMGIQIKNRTHVFLYMFQVLFLLRISNILIRRVTSPSPLQLIMNSIGQNKTCSLKNKLRQSTIYTYCFVLQILLNDFAQGFGNCLLYIGN